VDSPPVYGGSIPALIWHRFMSVATTGMPVQSLPGTLARGVPDTDADGLTHADHDAATEATGHRPATFHPSPILPPNEPG